MKTKTLLIAAATLAVGVIASQAQSNIYSANIVGYVNTPIAGNGQFTLIANPLKTVTSNGTNLASDVLTCLQGGENLYIWNGGGYDIYSFEGYGVGTGLGFPSDWIDLNGGAVGAISGDVYDAVNQIYWTQPPVLPQGVAAYIQSGVANTNSFVGTVVLANSVALAGSGQYSFVASTAPLGGDVANTNFNLPFVGGENVFVWNGGGYYIYSFEGTGVGTGLGFPSDYIDLNGGGSGAVPGDVYDAVNQVYWTQPLSVTPGQGLLIQSGGAETWTQNVILPN